MDEVWYAGATTSDNRTHYLYTGANYWTMSPRCFIGSHALAWLVISRGCAFYNHADGEDGVRPVANLQSGVEIISGDGTYGNPYTIK